MATADERIKLLRAETQEQSAEIEAFWDKRFGPELPDVLFNVVAEMDRPADTIPTGIRPLDWYLDGGIRAGEVFVVAARPSVGKSAFALQTLLFAATEGVGVLLWSLEMSAAQWGRRALSAMTGINSRLLRTGQVTGEHQQAIAEAANRLSNLPIWFGGTSTQPGDIADVVSYHLHRNQIGLVVVDYLQLMDRPNGESRSREQEVAQMSRSLKQLALTKEVGVMVVAQLNRNAEGRVPTLADLRESGAIEQDADEVFFLHRELDPDRHVLSLDGRGILAKNRDGECGSFKMRYDSHRFRFLPIAVEEGGAKA